MKKWIKRAGFGVGVLAALALCAYGLLMVMPFSNTSQLPQPVQEFAQSLPGSQASQEQERIAAADEPTHFVAADGVEYKDSTRQPSCQDGIALSQPGSLCAQRGWLSTTPVPVQLDRSSGVQEVQVPPSKFSGWVRSSAPLGSLPQVGSADVSGLGKFSLVVGHVNFGSWQDNAGYHTAMGSVSQAQQGDVVDVHAADGRLLRYRVVSSDVMKWADLGGFLSGKFSGEVSGFVPADVVLVTCHYDRLDAAGNPVYDSNTVVIAHFESVIEG